MLCTFIGYAEDQGTRVYQLYHKETGKTEISRDLVFDEAHRGLRSLPTGPSIEKDLAITLLEENFFQKLISQHLNESSTERENSQHKENDNLHPDDSQASEDDIKLEDSITLRAPILPVQIREPRLAEGVPTTAGASSSEHQATAHESASREPQRARQWVDHFKPGA